MDGKRVAEALRLAAARIRVPGQWTQDAFARSSTGARVAPDAGSAVCWCAEGAIRAEDAVAYCDAADAVERDVGTLRLSVKQPHDETRTLWSTHVAVTHERNEMAARIRALGPVQP